MTAFNNASRYRSAYSDYDEESEEEQDVHPSVERQAQQIVRRIRMRTLAKWWISFIGVAVIASAFTALVLITVDQMSYAAAASLICVGGTAYLTHRSLLPLR